MSDGFGFSKGDAARIARVVRRVERAYQNGTPPRGRYPAPADRGIFPGTNTTSITTGSPGSPTSFSFKLYYPSVAGSPALAADSVVYTGYNCYTLSSSIAAGKLIWVRIWNGLFYLVEANC